MKHYAVARNGNQFFVINGNYEIIERCHNRATAAHFAKKLNDSAVVTLEHDDPTDYDIALGDPDVVCPHTYAPAIFA